MWEGKKERPAEVLERGKKEEEEQKGQWLGPGQAGNWKGGQFGEVRTDTRQTHRFPSHLTILARASQAWRDVQGGGGRDAGTALARMRFFLAVANVLTVKDMLIIFLLQEISKSLLHKATASISYSIMRHLI